MTAPDAVPEPLAEAEPPNHAGHWAYDSETAIERSGPGRWTTTLHRHWNINDNPNGVTRFRRCWRRWRPRFRVIRIP